MSARADLSRGQLLLALTLILLTLLALTVRLSAVSPWLDSVDEVRFLNALRRYDLAAQRPQWPGYPVYIMLGRLLEPLTGPGEAALRTVSLVAGALCAPAAGTLCTLLARALSLPRRAAYLGGAVCAALVACAPGLTLTGAQLFSDPLGLLLALLTILSAWCTWQRASPGQRRWGLLLTGTLAGLTLGVRLSYVALLGPLALLLSRRDWGVLTGALGAGAVTWTAWQFTQGGYVSGMTGHLRGHLTQWGGAVTTDTHLLTRPGRAVRTLLTYGLGGPLPGGPWTRTLPLLGWLPALAVGAAQLRARSPVRSFLLAWLAPQLLTFALHDVTFSRYFDPSVVFAAVLAGVGVAGALRRWPARARVVMTGAAAWTLCLLGVTVPVARLHAAQPDVEVAAAHRAAVDAAGRRGALYVETHPEFLERYAPRLTRRGGAQVIYATGEALAQATAFETLVQGRPARWDVVGTFTRDVQVQSRGLRRLTLYRLR